MNGVAQLSTVKSRCTVIRKPDIMKTLMSTPSPTGILPITCTLIETDHVEALSAGITHGNIVNTKQVAFFNDHHY